LRSRRDDPLTSIAVFELMLQGCVSVPSIPTVQQLQDGLAHTLAGTSSDGSVNVAFESLTVDTASRKFMELDRDTTPSVVAARSVFLSTMASNLAENRSNTLLAAMEAGGSALIGLGPEPGFDAPVGTVLYSASSLWSFFNYNVLLSWKQQTATALGLTDPDDPANWDTATSPVYQSFLTEIANQFIPEAMIDTSSMAEAAQSWSWWTPDARMIISPAADGPNSDAGTQAFIAFCWIVSLAPEWYPQGFITYSFALQDGDTIRRPTPYDGTTSPLWVQRPADQIPRTGGEATETLLGSALPITRVKPIPTYVIGQDLINALLAAPSVDVYAQNLCELCPESTGDSFAKLVAALQLAVTEQCRTSRSGSDRAFDLELAKQTCTCSTQEQAS
jgi:hypothetical protein